MSILFLCNILDENLDMMIRVDGTNVFEAGRIHSVAWKDSHRHFCSREFVERHTEEAQTKYLLNEMAAGKQIYMLIDEEPVGIVSIDGNVIENLYVSPPHQRKGYGSELLKFAMEACHGLPTLWVLSNNPDARRLYERFGFAESGKRKRLNPQLEEIEMVLSR